VKLFRNISQFFIIIAMGIGIYDPLYNGIVNDKIKVRTLAEFWKDISPDSFIRGKHTIGSILSPQITTSIFNIYTPLVLILAAIFFYIIYRIIFMIKGGNKSQRL